MINKVVLSLILLMAMIMTYENCGKEEAKSLSLASCTLDLQKGFADSYYVFTKQKCSGCHREGGAEDTRGKYFADPNISKAFSSFQFVTELKVRTFAVDETHRAGVTGPANQQLIDVARAAWVSANAKYTTCKSAVTGEAPPPPPASTVEKPTDVSGTPRIVNRSAPGYVAPGLVNADFKTLTWNFASDLNGTVLNNTTFTMRYAFVDNGPSATDHDYLFIVSNPTIINNSGANIKVKTINVKLNGSQYYDGTTFNSVNTILTNGQSRDLMAVTSTTSSATMVVRLGKTLTPPYTLGILFDTLGTTSEAPPVENIPVAVPTFTSLFGNGGSVRNSCVGCHGPTVQNGNGFRVDSYASVITRVQAGNSAGSLLYQRMTNTAAPMPPAGLLPAATANNVKLWIDAGAPNN
ncbi:MAG: hypothetical protein A4S09_07020 [Proteobacteria bacterium SG_bin7]|nr:MAG: hypothetical protein A4S09_07020 [Proteobacteria bacterium SG_bin7]